MCGIAAVVNSAHARRQLQDMVQAQAHRGPDGQGVFVSATGTSGLGHNRLTIIDTSDAASQPMASTDGRYVIVFNGEIYNYRELRAELPSYPYRSQSDTEVILAAYERWGHACLPRFIGMFAFAIWDEHEQRLFAARDRFGVKPLVYCHRPDGSVIVSSEIKALHVAGVPVEPDPVAWAGFLVSGASDSSERTFWKDVRSVPAGHALTVTREHVSVAQWYDLAECTGDGFDDRLLDVVLEEYEALLTDSVRLRFRSDVPVGINLSGGLDSSTLLGVVDRLDDETRAVKAFTFVTNDEAYDELPWVKRMLEGRSHPLITCPLSAADVPELALSVQATSDEPFGGVPTLAYARLFEHARAAGVTVLLDGQGMDEQWAGYSYYADAGTARGDAIVQGAKSSAVRPDCLRPEFRAMAEPTAAPKPYPDALRNLQYRDLFATKIPRALRFNDRASMRSSMELREPFLDHRLVELAMRQPADRKIRGGVRKWFLRQIAARLMPSDVVEAPKRPVQTPQREWLRGPLQRWADGCIADAIDWRPEWFDRQAVDAVWAGYRRGDADNSFFVWQWISLSLIRSSRGVSCASV